MACDAIGHRVSVTEALPDRADGGAGTPEPSRAAPGSVLVGGWLASGGRPVDCVVVVDRAGVVVGAGPANPARREGLYHFQVLTLEGDDLRVAVRFGGTDAFAVIPPIGG